LPSSRSSARKPAAPLRCLHPLLRPSVLAEARPVYAA
jgi:hypothetical protein